MRLDLLVHAALFDASCASSTAAEFSTPAAAARGARASSSGMISAPGADGRGDGAVVAGGRGLRLHGRGRRAGAGRRRAGQQHARCARRSRRRSGSRGRLLGRRYTMTGACCAASSSGARSAIPTANLRAVAAPCAPPRAYSPRGCAASATTRRAAGAAGGGEPGHAADGQRHRAAARGAFVRFRRRSVRARDRGGVRRAAARRTALRVAGRDGGADAQGCRAARAVLARDPGNGWVYREAGVADYKQDSQSAADRSSR